MDIELKCTRCKQEIHHTCNMELAEALMHLLRWVPESAHPEVLAGIRTAGVTHGWLDPGEEFEGQPFFGSQSWSYAMFGKEEARTFHALINNVMRAAGMDPNDIAEKAFENKGSDVDK